MPDKRVRGHLVAACLLTGLGTQVQAQPAAPEYDLVAVRVEFKPDTTRFTTGDGTFSGLSWPVESRVDPLPHDAAYFEAHLAFLRDYVAGAPPRPPPRQSPQEGKGIARGQGEGAFPPPRGG
ncbi:MAG: hypothetical protein OXI38_14390, partial [Bacteroidota bacterium]|nr:hypothetical protein [Bacteroidota bacterium]